MPFYYTEDKRFVTNAQGAERGDSTFSEWLLAQGAEHWGWDGDGTKGGATARLWKTAVTLADLPGGIAEITQADFDQRIADREANKPVPPPPVPDPDRDALKLALDDPAVPDYVKAIIRTLGIVP